MKKTYKIFGFCLLCSFVLCLTAGDAYADDVLQAVRSKALSFLQSLRPVIFILAGFGLIGFAWMAIFNKISWKWFANIAMGLFLVANMGLVVDYFSGNDGQRRELGYGNYLNQPDYIAMSGVASDPKEQSVQNDGTVTGKEDGSSVPNSDSDQLNNESGMMPGDFGEHEGGSEGEGENPTGSGSDEGESTTGGGDASDENDPKAACYAKGKEAGFAYSEETGCLSKTEWQDKVANNERKCKKQEGYEWIAPGWGLDGGQFGSCKKTKNQANKDCKAEKGDGWEWNDKAQQCVENKNTCKAKGNDYVYDNDKGCITKKEQCESQKLVNDYKAIWKDGKCVTNRDINKQECEAKGSDYTFVAGKTVSEDKCMTKKDFCESRPGTKSGGKMVWKDGKCITENAAQGEECKAKGSDYVWNAYKWECQKTTKAQKRDCEQTPGYFWSDQHSRCIKEED